MERDETKSLKNSESSRSSKSSIIDIQEEDETILKNPILRNIEKFRRITSEHEENFDPNNPNCVKLYEAVLESVTNGNQIIKNRLDEFISETPNVDNITENDPKYGIKVNFE